MNATLEFTLADLGQLAPPGNPDDFVILDDRPVFKEHVNDDGVKFDAEALERVCRRCNLRILDTGDFATLVLRHTKDDHSVDPEVIGFVGPYKLGTFGRIRPRVAILARWWVYRADIDKLRKYPRVSPEYWAPLKDPTNGYFDPVSLLGAETPELDLGIRYSKQATEDGSEKLYRYSRVLRYQATAPGGSNTFVPSTEDKDRYNKDDDGMNGMSPEQLQQLSQTFKPMIEEVVDQRLQAFAVSAKADNPDSPPAPETPEDPDQPQTGDKPVHYEKMCQLLAEGKDEEAEAYFNSLSDEDKQAVRAAIDSDSDEERKVKMTKYQAESAEQPGEGGSEPEKDTVAKYQKACTERDDYRAKYQKEVIERRKVETERDALRSQIASAEGEKRKAVRYQKLTELQGQGFVFEVDEEVADCADMDDERFAKHCDKIVNRYQRVPQGMIPVAGSPEYKGNPGEAEAQLKRQRYAKQAAENVLAARNRGEAIEYKTELDRLVAEGEKSAA